MQKDQVHFTMLPHPVPNSVELVMQMPLARHMGITKNKSVVYCDDLLKCSIIQQIVLWGSICY